MSSLFSQVAEVFTRRQAKKVEDREALVTAILAGGKKAPTPAQIATALDEMDWTPEALEKEVARRQQRQQDAAVLAEIPALEKEKGELEAKGNAEEARYQAVVKPLQAEHAKNMELLNGRYRYIVMRIPQAEGMRNKLIASYAGPLTDELDANRAGKANSIEKSARSRRPRSNTSTWRRSPSAKTPTSKSGAPIQRYWSATSNGRK